MEENEPEKEKKPDVNYSLYADQPDKLFPIAQEQFNKNKFEEGLDILEQSIILAVKKYGMVSFKNYYYQQQISLISKKMKNRLLKTKTMI